MLIYRTILISGLCLVPLSAQALDVGQMGDRELRQLQLRLQDAGCYGGTVDGVAGESTRAAISKCPDMTAKLRIEAEMHNAPIRRISLNKEQNLLAIGGDGKVVRIWRLPDGRLERVLRVPIGDGNEGKIYSVAMSPDGRFVAAGGWDAKDYVYMFDVGTGEIVRRFGPVENVINELEFSRDGLRLAAGLGGKNGVRVWQVASGRISFSDKEYKGQVLGLNFDAQGRLAATCYDGKVRLYDAGGRRIARQKVSGGTRPFGVAFSPDAKLLAVGYNDTTNVEIFDASNLKKLYSVETDNLNNDLASVAWSGDGEYVFAGGRYDVRGLSPVVRWSNKGRGKREEYRVARSTVMDVQAIGKRGFVWGAADPAFGIIDGKGERPLTREPVIADMRNKLRENFLVSRDVRRVRFGLGYAAREPHIFDVDLLTFEASPKPLANFLQADIDGLKVTDWEDKREPKVDGNTLKLKGFEISRALAVLPSDGGKRSFLLGADWSVYRFDETGDETWRFAVPGTTWGVNVGAKGRIAVAAFGDGTIRWFRTSDGKELLALFAHARDKRWVAWTPSGYYAASPGGEELMGWHLNRGWAQAPDFFSASRFREKFYRPDVVQLVLDTRDEDQAVAEANRIAKRRVARETLYPPVIEILAPLTDSDFRNQEVTLTYRVRSPSGAAIQSIEVLLDGRPFKARGRRVPAGVGELRTTIKVPARDVEVGLVARTAGMASEISRIRLKWAGRTQYDFDRPRLYALLVGVSNYDDPELQLQYAAKDARDLAAALKVQEGGLYREVTTKVLEDAEKGDVLDGLDWLSEQVTAKDVGLVFIAGHGVTDQRQRFYFLPKGGNTKRLRRTGIPEDEIRDVVSGLAGKVLFFIDACHSGETLTGRKRRGVADITQFVNELSSAENGVVMFASSTGREVSVEDPKWENGAFTEAILAGLAGAADYTGDKAITVKELDTYIADKVKQLTGGTQHPVTLLPGTIPDFPIAALE